MITDVYKRNKGYREIYSEIIPVDWYDGATSGIFKLDQSGQWFLFNMSFFSPGESIRIFFIIEVAADWVQEFLGMRKEDANGTLVNYETVKLKMALAFESHKGEVFLLRAPYLEDVDYEMAKVPLVHLKFVNTIEKSLEQDEKYIQQLNLLFSKGEDRFVD